MGHLLSRAIAVAVALGFAAGSAAAQTAYPQRAITLIVPFAAGGPTDVVARIAADHMTRTLRQTVIIENVVGAGGTTASTRAARAAPDGYTIEMGHMGTHAASVALYPNLAYKPDADFAPIGLVAGTPVLIRHLRQGQRRHAEHGACRRRFGVVHACCSTRSWALSRLRSHSTEPARR